MWICSMGSIGILHMWHELGLSQKGRKDGGGVSAQFSGMIIFSIELYYGDQLIYKCMKKVLSVTQLTP